MPRKKNKAKAKHGAKGSAKSTPQRTPAKAQQWHAAATPQAPSYSLREEARWVSGHRSAAFEAGKQLRRMPIAFVSAGHLQGTLKEKPLTQPADSASDLASDSDTASDASPPVPSSSSAPDNTAAMADMAIRSPSPAPSHSSSDSSADVVVFRGRGHSPLATTTSSRLESPSPPKDGATDAAPPVTLHNSASAGLSIRVKGKSSPQLYTRASPLTPD
jgi:hypothetical protein